MKKTTTAMPHKLPADMKKAIASDSKVLKAWDGITALAKNEWICWTTIVKKVETRKEHIERMLEDLKKGKRRPCCWPGCPHRRPNAAKWFSKLGKQKKS
jgi:uncharacterized protein YdeI (YjbR/CyaY-like superfamily)